jgi:hypothetical protein
MTARKPVYYTSAAIFKEASASAGDTLDPALVGISPYGQTVVGATTAALARSALGLATVASSGAYSDLSGLPTLGSLAALSAAPAGSLTGSTLASGVTASSLTSVGTLVGGSIPYSLLTGTPTLGSMAAASTSSYAPIGGVAGAFTVGGNLYGANLVLVSTGQIAVSGANTLFTLAPVGSNTTLLRSDGTGSNGMRMEDRGGNLLGFLYGDGGTGGNYGLLGSNANWRFRTTPSGAWLTASGVEYPMLHTGNLTANGGLDTTTYQGISGIKVFGSYTASNINITTSGTSGEVNPLEIKSDGQSNTGAYMTFNRPGIFANYFGLNSSNRLVYGGWSNGATEYQLHSTQDFAAPVVAATFNTPVLRSGDGSINSVYSYTAYHNSIDEVNTGTISYIMAKFGDNYYRSATPARVLTFLGIAASAQAATATTTAQRDSSGQLFATNLVASAADGYGLGLWASVPTVCGIYMSSQGATGAGRVSGDTTSDYNNYYRAYPGGTNRGHVFRWDTTILAGIDGAGNFRTIGNVTAGASDRRLKRDLQPITGALAALDQIGAYTYYWDQEACAANDWTPPTTGLEHGMIAQEWEVVAPDVVAPAPFANDQNFLTIKYERTVTLLLAALKELKEKVEELERKAA